MPDGRPQHIEQTQRDMSQAESKDSGTEFRNTLATQYPHAKAGYCRSESGHGPTRGCAFHQSIPPQAYHAPAKELYTLVRTVDLQRRPHIQW
jgi:hypothetical protein